VIELSTMMKEGPGRVTNFLDSILDVHPDLICRYDPKRTLIYLNKSCANFFGGTVNYFLGKQFTEFLPQKHLANAEVILSQITPKMPKFTSMQRFTYKDKADRWINWTNIGIFRPDGSIESFQSIGRDVTHEVILGQITQARQKELLSVRAELRSVIDAVPAMIWHKDDKNNILHLNEAAASSMGLKVEDVEGQNTYDLFGDAAKKYHDDDLKVIHSGEPYLGIVELFTPNDGEPGWVQTDKIPFNVGENTGSGKRLLVVSTDITKLKEKEDLLSAINKNLDDFTSLTSHDLKAPLRKIGLSAEMLSLGLNDKLRCSEKENLDDIRDGVEHMRLLIESFLKFMRAAPGGLELETLNLNDVIYETWTRLAPELEQINGILNLPSQPLNVKGDFALLGQVFSNLIENAIKYRSPERDLRIDISAFAQARTWVISVSDNGMGIKKSDTEHIFDLFGRAKPHLGVEGSGIGLALCKRIITLHGGTIKFLPSEESGSCFQLVFNQSGRIENGKNINSR